MQNSYYECIRIEIQTIYAQVLLYKTHIAADTKKYKIKER